MLNEEGRLQHRREYLEEGRQLRKKQEEEKAKLEKIKAAKLNHLRSVGVPDKYSAELARKKITT